MIYFLIEDSSNWQTGAISMEQSDAILVEPACSRQALLAATYRCGSARTARLIINGTHFPENDLAFAYSTNEESEALRCQSTLSLYDQITVEAGYQKDADGWSECLTPSEFLLLHRDILKNSPSGDWCLYQVSIYAKFIELIFHETGTGDCFEILRLKTPLQPNSKLSVEVPIGGELGYANVGGLNGQYLSLLITTPKECETLVSVNLGGEYLPAVRVMTNNDKVAIQKLYPINTVTEEFIDHLLAIREDNVYW